METPRYSHDCTSCTFLGRYEKADLYFCPQGGFPTIIARYSDEAGDYRSGMLSRKHYPDMQKAYDLALERNLFNPNQVCE